MTAFWASLLVPILRPPLAKLIGRMADAIGRQIPEGWAKRILLYRVPW